MGITYHKMIQSTYPVLSTLDLVRFYSCSGELKLKLDTFKLYNLNNIVTSLNLTYIFANKWYTEKWTILIWPE